MRELERVKQYVKKINEAKSKGAAAAAEAAREVTLNKEVAARFVKHDLVTTAAPSTQLPAHLLTALDTGWKREMGS